MELLSRLASLVSETWDKRSSRVGLARGRLLPFRPPAGVMLRAMLLVPAESLALAESTGIGDFPGMDIRA